MTYIPLSYTLFVIHHMDHTSPTLPWAFFLCVKMTGKQKNINAAIAQDWTSIKAAHLVVVLDIVGTFTARLISAVNGGEHIAGPLLCDNSKKLLLVV